MAAAHPFLVLKLPRTGSSMFGRVLNAHPSILCANEFLNPHKDAPRRDKVRAFEAFYRDATDEVAGQTMNPFKYKLRPRDVRRGLGEVPVKAIVLLRENALKQSISNFLARERNYKSSRAMVKNQAALASREFDVAELTEMVRRFNASADRLRRFADRLRVETLHLTYEQLQGDAQPVFDSVFTYIGAPPAPPGFDYAAGYKKMLSDDLRDVVANFAELAAVPELAPYLERN